MKLNEMRELSDENIKKEISDRKKELMELRFQASFGSLSQPHRVKKLRREVAQLNTISRQRQGEKK